MLEDCEVCVDEEEGPAVLLEDDPDPEADEEDHVAEVDVLGASEEVLLEPTLDIDVELDVVERVDETTDEVGVMEDELGDLEDVPGDIELDPEMPELVLEEVVPPWP